MDANLTIPPSSTIVFQSIEPGPRPRWLERCLASVRAWADRKGHAHALLGDELFQDVPDWLMARCSASILPATDLGRLFWAQRLLGQGFKRAIWIDADVLIFDPDGFDMPPEPGTYFTHEIWLGDGGVESLANNSVMVVDAGSTLIPFYIESCLRIAAGHEGGLPKLSLGTDLLSPLHLIVPLPLIAGVGLLEARLMEDVLQGGGPYLSRYLTQVGRPLGAANLCRSLGALPAEDPHHISQATFEAVVERLLEHGALRPPSSAPSSRP